MSKSTTKYFSIFFLLLFLFPLAEKQAHAFQHHNDLHCSATNKHFHSEEHICSICDFNTTDSNTLSENYFSFVVTCFDLSFTPFAESTNSLQPFHHLPSRAPPIV
jgi:hypothetical protein